MKKRTWKMSASCIGCLKACPTRFRAAYVEGLRLAEDTDSQRIGTNWHGLTEVAELPGDNPLDRAVAWLNEKYATVPPSKSKTEWEIERVILAYSLAGWLWYYQNDGLKTVSTEIKFDLPLRNPETGRALPNVRMVGKIDRIVLDERDRHVQLEKKSTGKSIDSDSSFWQHLSLDTQISCYRAACHEMWAAGDLKFPVVGTIYDVWHKPGIRPKKLTQAESKAFIDGDNAGEYCGQKFVITPEGPGQPTLIDGVMTDFEPGKKEGTYAIRETPEMFGARLLADIYERPEFYFARREIARTDDQIRRHQGEVHHLYKIAREMERTGYWWGNESQCEATFHCAYIPICYNGMEVFDGKTTPPGFKRIFDSELPVEET